MQSFIRSFTLFSVVAFTASLAAASNSTTAQAPVFVAPNGLTECKPYNLTWLHGKHPYKLFIYNGCDSSDDSDAPLVEVENIQGAWAEWTPKYKNGTSLMFGIEDVNGKIDYSDDVTIYKGSDDCIGKNATWKLPAVSDAASNSVSIGSNPPTTAHPTGTYTGIANVASGGPNAPKKGGASSLKASGALAALVAMIAVAASS